MKKNRSLFRLSVFLILVLFLSCTTATELENNPADLAAVAAETEKSLLVETEWLFGFKNHSKLRIVDYGRKLEDFDLGHIPGAVFIDRKVAWDTVDGILGMLPPIETVVAELVKAGVSNDSVVVIYDSFCA